MTRFQNLTSNDMLFVLPDGSQLELPAAGLARRQAGGATDAFVDINCDPPCDVVDSPASEAPIVYIISQEIASIFSERRDLPLFSGILSGTSQPGDRSAGAREALLDRSAVAGPDAPEFNVDGAIFVSYRSADGLKAADEIDALLQAIGLRPWRDVRDLPPGNVRRRLELAIAGGLSGAVLVITEGVAQSDIVRTCELPGILGMAARFSEFTCAIANGSQASSPDAEMDLAAPERILRLPEGQLQGFKQYDIRDLKSDGPVIMVAKLLDEYLTHHLRTRPLLDRPFVIDVQTRLPAKEQHVPNADLGIRLDWAEAHTYPDRTGLDALSRVIVPLSDAVYGRSVRTLRFTGGATASVGLALGCTFTSRRAFPSALEIAQPATAHSPATLWNTDDCGSLDVSPQKERRLSELCDSSGDRVAILVTMSPSPNMGAFDGMVRDRGPFREVWWLRPPTEGLLDPAVGVTLAARAGEMIHDLATDIECHLCVQGPFGFTVVLGRFLNAMNIVAYEFDQYPRARYVPALRLMPGTKPISEVLLPSDKEE